jgi:hypothetical protein
VRWTWESEDPVEPPRKVTVGSLGPQGVEALLLDDDLAMGEPERGHC